MNLNAFFDDIEKSAKENIKANEGDYILDGLLHCGKCKSPKQVRVTILDKERTPYCLCKCEVEKREKEEAEYKRIEFDKRVKELRRTGFSQADMQSWTFENDDGSNQKLTDAMKKYVENFDTFKAEGKGLLLFGTVGTGKTFLAACVANALIDKGIPVLITRVTDVAQGLFDGKVTYQDYNQFPLLVLDDLGAERKTEYMQEIVYNFIDARYRANLPIIITSNLTRAELLNPADITYQRIYSRLFEMCTPIEVSGKDRRQKALRDDIGKIKEILGL